MTGVLVLVLEEADGPARSVGGIPLLILSAGRNPAPACEP